MVSAIILAHTARSHAHQAIVIAILSAILTIIVRDNIQLHNLHKTWLIYILQSLLDDLVIAKLPVRCFMFISVVCG